MVEERIYKNIDSAKRALRKWGIGVESYDDYISGPWEVGYIIQMAKDGPIKRLKTAIIYGERELPSKIDQRRTEKAKIRRRKKKRRGF